MLLGGRTLALTHAALLAVLALGTAAAACGDDWLGETPAPLLPEAGSPDVDAGKAGASLCVDGKPVDWPPGPYGIALTSVLPPGYRSRGRRAPSS